MLLSLLIFWVNLNLFLIRAGLEAMMVIIIILALKVITITYKPIDIKVILSLRFLIIINMIL